MKFYTIVMNNEILVSMVREDRLEETLRGFVIVGRDDYWREIFVERK